MLLIQDSVYVEIKDDYDGDDDVFFDPPFPGLSFLVYHIPWAPWVALPNLTLACLHHPTPPSLGSQRPLDFLYSIGAKATLGVVVVVDGYDDDDEEENGQGENGIE